MIDNGENLTELPKGWASATIPEMIPLDGVFIDGDWVESKDQDPDGDIRLIQLADVGDGIYRNKSNRYLTRKKAIELGCTFLERGDVLIARMPDPLGRACIFPGDIKEAITAVDVCIVRTGKIGVDNRWLMFAANSPAIRKTVESLQAGTTRKRISRKNLATICFPLPPANEQKRIVAKIEELFTKLDKGVEGLKKVKAELKRYRQTVLKYAFEGKLTTEWREKNKDKLEPTSKLLEHIAKEREKNSKGKAKKIPPLDTSNLPELPDGWEWVTLPYIVKQEKHSIKRGPFGSAIKKAFFVPSGYKVYEQRNAIYNDFTIGRYFIDDAKFNELKAFEVRPGDLIISCSGTIGKIAIVPDNAQKGIINQALLKITLNNEAIETKYFMRLFSSFVLQQEILSNVRGSAMLNISSVEIVKQIPFALAPIQEQQQIVAEIERHFSIADEVEQTVERSLKEADRLRQSVLKRAFEGKLVAQDPADEPAEILLERIRQQREQQRTVKAKPKPVKVIKHKHTKGIYFRRGAVISYIVDNLCDNNTFGRTQLEKAVHLTQYHLGIDLEFVFIKKAAGPFDKEVIKVESLATKRGWFNTYEREGTFGYYYRRGENISDRCSAAVMILGSQKSEMDRLISVFNKMDTDQAEIFDTVYAVWNDLLLDHIEPTEDKIKEGFYAWSDEKKRFTPEQVYNCIEWIKENNFVPVGRGLKTEAI